MNKEPFVKIKNLSKTYKGTHDPVLHNLSFEIMEGEIFALLGPSGCGKSTFLRIISGFEDADEGEILIDGQNILNLPAYKRPVNMMFQNYALFPHMTIEDNISFGLKQEKLPSNEIKDRTLEAIEMVGLEKLKNRYPHQLSGGQQQRAALARSIVKRPKLLLLDEPLGSLDRKTREKTHMELIKIQSHLNLTFVIVTHEQDEAMSLAHRIGLMKDGNILQIGTSEEIYERPSTKFVANFVGSINIFEGIIKESKDNKVRVFCTSLNTEMWIEDNKQYAPHQEVSLALRPEELAVTSFKPSDAENILEGKIINIGFLGSEIFYHIELSDEKIIHVSVPTAARSKNLDLAIDKNAYVTWHLSDGVILES
jgi:putrescine transport system ATP-binding protein